MAQPPGAAGGYGAAGRAGAADFKAAVLPRKNPNGGIQGGGHFPGSGISFGKECLEADSEGAIIDLFGRKEPHSGLSFCSWIMQMAGKTGIIKKQGKGGAVWVYSGWISC